MSVNGLVIVHIVNYRVKKTKWPDNVEISVTDPKYQPLLIIASICVPTLKKLPICSFTRQMLPSLCEE